MSTRATPGSKGSLREASGAALLVVSGLILTLFPLIDTQPPAGLWTAILSQFTGFVLSLLGLVLVSRGTPRVGRVFLVLGASLALFTWTWPFHIGIFFYVPPWIGFATAAIAYTGAAVTYATAKQPKFSVVGFVLSAGYLWTTILGYLSPIYAPPLLYLPIGAAMIGSGLLIWILPNKPQEAAGSLSDPIKAGGVRAW